ncbi:MAG TPA: phosphoheptose isomerase [Desulfobacteraceae bacterium]|nr:phosphoheptose isomerase [Desulfobacteraceae bacterium]
MKTIDTLAWLDILSAALKGVMCKIDGEESGLKTATENVQNILAAAREREASVYWVGNGGSCAICSHLSQDLINKLAIRSLFLNDSPLMTCMANDYGYEDVYARPLDTFAREGDVLIAISSSGNSPNIMNAVDVARKKKMTLVTLSGFKPDNRLWNASASVSFMVPGTLYGIVEAAHEVILHGIIETLWLDAQ